MWLIAIIVELTFNVERDIEEKLERVTVAELIMENEDCHTVARVGEGCELSALIVQQCMTKQLKKVAKVQL